MLDKLTYKLFGNSAILIEWTAKIDEQILKDIIQFKDKVIANKKNVVEDCILGYHSLTIVYSNKILDFESESNSLKSLYSEESTNRQTINFLWHIPVCYDIELGIDLEEVSEKLKLSIEEVIQLHSEAMYTVYFIGFLPGFLYLGGLDNRLEIKRKSDPRLHVAKGSVAIGGSQTGVYPQDSAGGWNIIGKTPCSFFNIDKKNPCFAKPGDKIQFVPITFEEYKLLEIEVNRGTYEPSKSKLNG